MNIVEHLVKVQVLQQEGVYPNIWQAGHLLASAQKEFSTAKGHVQVVEMTPQKCHHSKKGRHFINCFCQVALGP